MNSTVVRLSDRAASALPELPVQDGDLLEIDSFDQWNDLGPAGAVRACYLCAGGAVMVGAEPLAA